MNNEEVQMIQMSEEIGTADVVRILQEQREKIGAAEVRALFDTPTGPVVVTVSKHGNRVSAGGRSLPLRTVA